MIFALSGYVTYRLAVHLTSHSIALTALVLYLFCGYALNWGTEVMPDFTAVLFSTIALLQFLRFAESRRPSVLTYALVAGLLGGLAKVTTAVLTMGIALGGLLIARYRLHRTTWVVLAWASAAWIPALTWNAHADRVKASSIHTAYTTSRNLASWQFGPWRDRVEMGSWQTMLRHTFEPIVGSVIMAVLLLVLALGARRHRYVVAALTASMVAGPAAFAGLYLSHDHYFIASMPAFAIVAGIALGHVSSRLAEPGDRSGPSIVAAVATIGLVILSWTSPEGVENMNRLLLRQRAIVGNWEEIREATQPDDRLIVIGLDTNPSLLFDVDRKGLMLRPNGSRPEEGELGTFYEFVYWAEPDPTAEQWAEYFPPELRYEPISANFYRIFPLTN